MNVVIIDDEKLARENLKLILNQNFQKLTILAEADSVETGVELLNRIKPDLVFLDINLFDGSGFNILEELDEINFQVIFVTAYNDYAIRAFRVNAIDYILKPINIDELSEAVIKAIAAIEKKQSNGLKEALDNLVNNQRIAIKENSGIRFVEIANIIRCKSDNNYTDIILATGERILSSRTLKEYSEILEIHHFFRIHQSHLVNLKNVKRIIKKDGVSVELDNGDVLEVSRRKKEGLMLKLNL